MDARRVEKYVAEIDGGSGAHRKGSNLQQRKSRRAAYVKSEEISKRIDELEAEKERLKEELVKSQQREFKERERNQFDKTKAFILRLWNIYWKDEDNSEAQIRLDAVKDLWRLDIWIEADVKHVLKKTKLSALDKIKDLIDEYGVKCNLDECVMDAKTRLDFAEALRSVRRGTDLSGRLGYGFDPGDLMELMKLHKSNKFRRKIEDLLEDCNYHAECGLLCDGNYDEFEKLVNGDCA